MNKFLRNLGYILPGLLLAGIGVLLLCRPGLELPFAAGHLAARKQNIRTLEEAIAKAAQENRKLLLDTRQMLSVREMAATGNPPQDPVICFRERLENAGKQAGMLIRAIGDIQRREAVPGELETLEVSFSAEGQIDNFLAFAEELWNHQPRIYWKSLTVKPVIANAAGGLTLNGVAGIFLFGNDHEE